MQARKHVPPFLAHSLVLLFIPGLLLLLSLPVRTSDTIWKHYRILTVTPAEHEADVVARLGAAGSSRVVTQSNTVLPRGNSLSPVQPFIDEVNAQRSQWFIDPDTDTRFFFLPDEPDLDNRVRVALSPLPVHWYLEQADSFYRYFFCPLFILLIAGLFLQKNRGLVVFMAIPSFMLVYSWNNLPGMLSSSIILALIIVIADLLDTGMYHVTPAQLLHRIRENILLLVPLVVPFGCAIFSGLRVLVLFIATMMCTVSLAILYQMLRTRFELHMKTNTRRFHSPPGIVPMHPATLYRRHFFRKNVFVFLALILAISSGVTGLIFVTARGETPFTGNGQLYLPCPSGYTGKTGFSAESFEEFIRLDRSDSLPDLADFLAVQWKIAVFPWKDYRDRLEPPYIGEKMVIENYVFDEKQGRLAGIPQVVAVFDQDFIRETLSEQATPLEEMLMDQGRFVSGRMTGHPE